MKIKISLVSLCVLMCLMVSSGAQSALIRPDASVAGRSQAEWSVAWWQWLLSFPENQNPNVDTSGAFSFLGDQGPVFFLAATFGSKSVTRSATVRSNQFLFFPLISTVTWEQISAYGGSEAGLRRDAAETIGIGPDGSAPSNTLFAGLDGVDLALPSPTTSLFDFRQMSPPGLFDVTLPPGAVLGLPPGTFPSVSDGWWLMLGPLAPGNYELHYGGTAEGIGAYAGGNFFEDNTLSSDGPDPRTLHVGNAAARLRGPWLCGVSPGDGGPHHTLTSQLASPKESGWRRRPLFAAVRSCTASSRQQFPKQSPPRDWVLTLRL
jgi:hypothetical protein